MRVITVLMLWRGGETFSVVCGRNAVTSRTNTPGGGDRPQVHAHVTDDILLSATFFP